MAPTDFLEFSRIFHMTSKKITLQNAFTTFIAWPTARGLALVPAPKMLATFRPPFLFLRACLILQIKACNQWQCAEFFKRADFPKNGRF